MTRQILWLWQSDQANQYGKCTHDKKIGVLDADGAIVLLSNVLILQRLENHFSTVELVTGKVKYACKSLPTSWIFH